MASKPKKLHQYVPLADQAESRACFPASGGATELPADYAGLLAEPKRRITEQRLRVVVSANTAVVLLCPRNSGGILPGVEELEAELTRAEAEEHEEVVYEA